MQEIWKDIEGFERLYQISNLGRIKSVSKFINNNSKSKKIGFYSKEKIIKFSKSKNNYLIAPLSKNGKAYYFYVHRLVAKTFIRNSNNLPQIDHLDGNKQNNIWTNLEWVSPKTNINRAWTLGLYKRKIIHTKVLQYDLDNNFINLYNSVKDASEKNNFGVSSIRKCCNNKQKSAYGFIWRYADK